MSRLGAVVDTGPWPGRPLHKCVSLCISYLIPAVNPTCWSVRCALLNTSSAWPPCALSTPCHLAGLSCRCTPPRIPPAVTPTAGKAWMQTWTAYGDRWAGGGSKQVVCLTSTAIQQAAVMTAAAARGRQWEGRGFMACIRVRGPLHVCKSKVLGFLCLLRCCASCRLRGVCSSRRALTPSVWLCSWSCCQVGQHTQFTCACVVEGLYCYSVSRIMWGV